MLIRKLMPLVLAVLMFGLAQPGEAQPPKGEPGDAVKKAQAEVDKIREQLKAAEDALKTAKEKSAKKHHGFGKGGFGKHGFGRFGWGKHHGKMDEAKKEEFKGLFKKWAESRGKGETAKVKPKFGEGKGPARFVELEKKLDKLAKDVEELTKLLKRRR